MARKRKVIDVKSIGRVLVVAFAVTLLVIGFLLVANRPSEAGVVDELYRWVHGYVLIDGVWYYNDWWEWDISYPSIDLFWWLRR